MYFGAVTLIYVISFILLYVLPGERKRSCSVASYGFGRLINFSDY
jgi:hypothetical protein